MTFKQNVITMQTPRFPMITVLIATILLCISLIWFGIYNIGAANELQNNATTSLHAMEVRGNILQYDEILTMSALTYALTGDPKWSQRYHLYEPLLANSIREAENYIPARYLENTTKLTSVANQKLVNMEHQALHLVDQGNMLAAKTILFGDEYQTQKSLYKEGMSTYDDLLIILSTSEINYQFKKLFFITLIFSLIFLIGIFTWLLTLKNIFKWKKLYEIAMQNEIDYKNALEESHRSLEVRVQKRTEELEELNGVLRKNEANLIEINRALQASESKFHLVIENTSVGMAVLTLEERFVEVNHALCELFGYSREDLLHMNFDNIMVTDDLEKERENKMRLTEGKISSFQIEKRGIHKDSHLFWVLVSTSLLPSNEEEPRLISQVQDISMLKEREHIMTIMNKMNDMLQSCLSPKEAYSIIDSSAKELFPHLHTGLAIFNKETKNFEVAFRQDINSLKDTFLTEDCWGLRAGHIYHVDMPKEGTVCKHFSREPEGGYICIPLIVGNEILGLLNQTAEVNNTIPHHYEQVAVNFSDIVKLSLANIKMREELTKSKSKIK